MTAEPAVRRSARRWRAAFAVGAATLIAACQPLPHPFSADRPPAALLGIRDSAGVSVAAVVGTPPAVAAKLGAAVATAFLKRDIPASARTTSIGNYRLFGRLGLSGPHDETATVTALWRLYDAKGRIVGERKVQLDAAAADWDAAKPGPIERLAVLSADGLAPLIEEAAPVEAAAPPGAAHTSIAVGKVTGAPGDGGTALAAAVATVLKRLDLTIVEDHGKADLLVDGEVTVSPTKGSQQHVKITWHVRRKDGAEIGTVGEENDVPDGMLEGSWGDVAYSVAIAASDGLAQLIARGAP